MPFNVEDLFIDFCELIGGHSSANLAHTVYEILSFFGLKGQVRWSVCFIYAPTELLVYIMALSSDNAANNDTMMEGLELLLAGNGIEFSAEEAHVHYMPHTGHLAAMEVDELYSNSSVSLVYINSSFHSCSCQLVHSKMTRKVPIVPIRIQLLESMRYQIH